MVRFLLRKSKERFCHLGFDAATLCFLLAACGLSQALQCGDTISANTTLHADLGPCPGDALVIDNASNPVTLDVNGYSIKGSGSGNGVFVMNVQPGLTIKGPGFISNFQNGVQLSLATGSVLVYDLTLKRNDTGIAVGSFRSGTTRIMHNTIHGGDRGQVGVAVGNVSGSGETRVYKNVISGQATAAVTVNNSPNISQSIIDQNLVTQNQSGIKVSSPAFNCFRFRGNSVISNLGTGIVLGSDVGDASMRPAAPPSCDAIVEDNNVSCNQGSGITVEGGPYSPMVDDNTVISNQGYGIAVSGTSDSNLSVNVSGNRALRNSQVDLFWNEVGATPCWFQNIYDTSQPPMLPSCP
jgi:hypothetical protein